MAEDPNPAATAPGQDRESWFAALFASLVAQLSTSALMMLGRIPHPETGKTSLDLEAARIFIDQLEMLEAKTKGNLSAPENHMLKQSLMEVRMGFVEAVGSGSAEPTPGKTAEPQQTPTAPAPETPEPATPSEEETRKRFSKKY
jgi:hypothetical protein